MHTRIFFLPDELLLRILENLDYKDVLACKATCLKLRNITTFVSLQYTVELAGCGMLDGKYGQPERALDITERLERLREYDAAWRELKWTGSMHLPHLTGQSFSAHTGPLVFCLPGTDRPHIIQEVPSKLRGTREAHYNFHSEPEERIKVDSSQDLVAYLEDEFENTRYSLKSLSTGEPHPLAANLGVIPLGDSQAYSSILDIRGDYLLEMGQFASPTGLFIVRNWKTGLTELQKHMDIRDRPRCYFLDDKHVIFTVNTSFSHDPDDFLATSFRVLPFRRSEGSTTGTVADAAVHFLLPPFMHSQEFFATTDTSTRKGGLSPAYFHGDPDDRLFSLSILKGAEAGGSFRDHYILDIPSQTFTFYMRDHPTTGHSVVPWDAWGPHGARVTRNDVDGAIRGRSICGMRRCHYKWKSDEGTILTVMDYHPGRVARGLARIGDGDGTAIERGAHVGANYTGCDPLSTTLPCLVTETLLPKTLGRVVLCEDGIVFIKYDELFALVSDVWAYTI
ncbi:hypothetical protein BV25DRAFT_1920866 [Artomyces pyxidatus]|uniref:Uncharacterized protein n=1 Tax=Artomyces pyxidatus TaxID=48021 RepID=A0ACB8SJK0_9AGAM|nr:hypothetical protein BV25DRAFT_1920866 [Artomyces pyxidatus]